MPEPEAPVIATVVPASTSKSRSIEHEQLALRRVVAEAQAADLDRRAAGRASRRRGRGCHGATVPPGFRVAVGGLAVRVHERDYGSRLRIG